MPLPALYEPVHETGARPVMMGAKKLTDQIADGTAKVDGNLDVLKQLGSTMVAFEIGFEILPGTKMAAPEADLNDFEVGPLESVHE
jgi:hypothetical protein